MNSLIRSFGPFMTALIVMLCSIWVVVMIVAPQLIMVEQSFWHWRWGGDDAALSARVDDLYNQVDTLGLDKSAAEAATATPEQTQKVSALSAKITGLMATIQQLEKQEVKPKKIYSMRNYLIMGGGHFAIFIKTILASLAVTLIALVVCYPIAYTVAKLATPSKAAIILLGLVIPYSINELLRIFAWLMILNHNGVANFLLQRVGIEPIAFLDSGAGVFVAMVYAYILFMVFPIYNTVETLDTSVVEAARDLGAPMWKIHWHIVLPHAKPGIAVGSIMTFMLAAGSYSVPYVMTRGTSPPWFTQLIYNKFFESNNWNTGAAYAFTLLIACTLFIFVMMRIFGVSIKDVSR